MIVLHEGNKVQIDNQIYTFQEMIQIIAKADKFDAVEESFVDDNGLSDDFSYYK